MKHSVTFVFALVVACTAIACGGPSASDEGSARDTPVIEAAATSTPVPAIAAAVAPSATARPEPQPKRKVVVLDPGHGGDEVGAAAHGVIEKVSNLDFAFRVEKLLLTAGVDVVLTRRADVRAAPPVAGLATSRNDLQTRVDIANAAGGDVFVSIHSNGSTDAAQNGIEAWHDSDRSFAAENKLLAGLLVQHTLSELRTAGFPSRDRGLYDGACFRFREGRCVTLFVIGGPRASSREEVIRRGGDPAALGFGDADVVYSRPTNMPAALVELLIITNAADATQLRNEAARDAMARGVARAILEFLGLPSNLT